MELSLFSGASNKPLAKAVAAQLGRALGRRMVERFPDNELRVRLEESVRGHDVYLLQPTSPPVAEHLLELLLLADACRRAGAARITGVVPYFGYARQDRRAHVGEPVGAHVLAEILSLRLSRIITVDLHTAAIEGFFSIPLEHLSAIPPLAEALRQGLADDSVVVAPDLGAVKLAQDYADRLGLPVAYVHKVRADGQEVSVRGVIGAVAGRAPIVVDDMISTGATMVSAIESLLEQGCRPEITVLASHGLFVGDAAARFADLPLRRILVTDSVGFSLPASLPVEVVSLDRILAGAIRGLHDGRSIEHWLRHR